MPDRIHVRRPGWPPLLYFAAVLAVRTVRISLLTSGAKRARTADLLHAMQALYQLSYSPDTARVTGTRTGDSIPVPRTLPNIMDTDRRPPPDGLHPAAQAQRSANSG